MYDKIEMVNDGYKSSRKEVAVKRDIRWLCNILQNQLNIGCGGGYLYIHSEYEGSNTGKRGRLKGGNRQR